MMNRSYTTMAAARSALVLSTTLAAQKTTPLKSGSGGSPHVRSEWAIDGANISIEYGRPAMKGRPEALMLPAGQIWRTGADEQTTLNRQAAEAGRADGSAGTYGLHSIAGVAADRVEAPGRLGHPVSGRTGP
jgi:hypothetical protein